MAKDSDGESCSGHAPTEPFTAASIAEIENTLGDVTRAVDYPMSRVRGASGPSPPSTAGSQATGSPEAPARATTNPGGRATTPAPPPVLLSQPTRSQVPPVPRNRFVPMPPSGTRPSPRPAMPATITNVREIPVIPVVPPVARASPSVLGTAGQAVTTGSGVTDTTTPNHPGGYPAPPPFRHNWDTPNRRAAFGSRDPRRSLRAGPIGPPIGSRPRPSTEVIPTAPTQQRGEASSEQSTSSDSNSRANQAVRAAAAKGAQTSRSALPGFDPDFMSVEQAAVVAADTRPTTIYIDRGLELPNDEEGSDKA